MIDLISVFHTSSTFIFLLLNSPACYTQPVPQVYMLAGASQKEYQQINVKAGFVRRELNRGPWQCRKQNITAWPHRKLVFGYIRMSTTCTWLVQGGEIDIINALPKSRAKPTLHSPSINHIDGKRGDDW